jgi:hypothetical protein
MTISISALGPFSQMIGEGGDWMMDKDRWTDY